MKHFFLYWITLLMITSCQWKTLPTPTATPLFPSRSIDSTGNFPWRERWRLRPNLFGYYQNVRNLVAIEQGSLFIDEWTLKFVEAKQGNLVWSVDFDGPIDSMVTDENLVYVAGHAGKIVEAYNLQTGDLAWKLDTQLPGHTSYYLHLQGDTLLVYNTWDSVYSLSTIDGQLIEKYKIPQIGQNPFSLLRLDEQSWLQSNGTQMMLLKDSQIVWKTNLGGEPQKFPYLYDDVVIVRVEDERTVFASLAGLDVKTGNVLWQREVEFYSNFALLSNQLFVVSKEADILVLDTQTGRTVGFADLLPNQVDTFHPTSAIAVNENMLYAYFADSQELIAFGSVQK